MPGRVVFSQGLRWSLASGEAELSVRDDHRPGPAFRGLCFTQPGPGPARGLLEQAERVLQVESAQVAGPGEVDVVRAGAGG